MTTATTSAATSKGCDMTTFCAYPTCGHSSEAHPLNGPCVVESCPCYAMVSSPSAPKAQKVAKLKADLGALTVCYCCGRPGCSLPRCPYFNAAKKIT